MSDLEPFQALIGTWATEATHPQFDGVVVGSITFEWLEGGKFLLQRGHNEHEMFPDAIWVIGAPESGEGLVAEYFDSRGVRRTYAVSLEDGVLRIWRDAPGFDQRFSAPVERDSFDGSWQLAQTPGARTQALERRKGFRAQLAGELARARQPERGDVSRLALPRILAGGLAQRARARIVIEHIIDHLECEPYGFSISIQ